MPQELQVFGTGALIEQPNSPTWERGETVRVTQVFKSATYDLARLSMPERGTLATGDLLGLRCANSTCTKERGGIGVLTIVWEGIPFGEGVGETPVPGLEPEKEFDQQEFALEKHPAFAILDRETIEACHAYAEATSRSEKSEHAWIFFDQDGPTDDELEARIELAERLLAGVTHFKLDLPRYVYAQYYVDEPDTDGGGYFEFPFGPMSVPSGWDWMRLPDGLTHTGTFWKLTRRWQAVINPDTYIYPV